MVCYLSVRVKPPREEVAHAQALYARMHDGALRLHRLHEAERSFVDEAGRSFAIVASEIRNFAQRHGVCARRITAGSPGASVAAPAISAYLTTRRLDLSRCPYRCPAQPIGQRCRRCPGG
ncbi:unnamed protein product (plasmid) [Mycetohabitans rhizoxinica HKI 454]|uniref:Uncharacterized protein n=1 Tax=Mycetohabitans rhizoxinica (strain DSM 19002 / CIP 109453 / HKI 454) TaxID=882378 RepID=E5AUU8_MYCRK|nr:unnamed protein product [Mycetohabitans rhizoxinica HKI 454]